MDWVTRQNIERFEKLLAAASDPAERTRLQRLLDSERNKASMQSKQHTG